VTSLGWINQQLHIIKGTLVTVVLYLFFQLALSFEGIPWQELRKLKKTHLVKDPKIIFKQEKKIVCVFPIFQHFLSL